MIAVDQTVGALVISAAFFYAFELVSLYELVYIIIALIILFLQVQRLFPPYNAPFSLAAVVQAGTQANRRNLWATLVANWYCWPFINFVNFHWIPVQYRVLFANVAAVFWNMFLSNIANK
jgi:hypothetical protein